MTVVVVLIPLAMITVQCVGVVCGAWCMVVVMNDDGFGCGDAVGVDGGFDDSGISYDGVASTVCGVMGWHQGTTPSPTSCGRTKAGCGRGTWAETIAPSPIMAGRPGFPSWMRMSSAT